MRLHSIHSITPLLVLCLLTLACDDKSSGGKTDAKAAGAKATDAEVVDAKAANAKAAAAKAEAKAEAKAADAKAEAKAAAAKAEAKAADAKAEAKAADATATEEKPAPAPAATPAPATAEEATRQLAAWLDDPTKAGVPALLSAPGEIAIAERCGACDDEKKAKVSKISGVAAFTKKAGELRDSVISEMITSDEDLRCKKGCCTFVPDPEFGVGDVVVHIETICVALDGSGKPTAYTKLETTGSY